jgi:two-component system, NarL family, sensor kinase
MLEHGVDGAPRSLGGARRGFALFLTAGLVGLVGISLGTVLASRHVAEADALDDARRTADRTAAVVVAPLLTDALNGAPGARVRLDEEVHSRLEEGSIVEVAVWAADGTVVYAGRGHDIGQRLALPDAARTAIERHERTAEFDDSPRRVWCPASTGSWR